MRARAEPARRASRARPALRPGLRPLLLCVALAGAPAAGAAEGGAVVGSYVCGFAEPPDALVVVARTDGELSVAFPGSAPLLLEPGAEDTWQVAEDAGAKAPRGLRFVRSGDGLVASAVWIQEGWELPMPRYVGLPEGLNEAQRVAALVDSYARRGLFSGSVVWARGGEVVHASEHGLADREHGLPCDAATRFDVASVSKIFTAFAVRSLVREEELELEAPVSRYLTELAGAPIGAATIRQLLEHTSGLPRSPFPDSDQLFVPHDRRDILGAIRSAALESGPGADYRYSNAGYQLLALTVERRAATDFASFLGRRVFGPAGMTRTHLEDRVGLREHAARPYLVLAGEYLRAEPIQATNRVGSGGVLTSTGDLLAWDAYLRAELAGQRLLLPAADGHSTLGYVVRTTPSGRFLEHGGNGAGTNAWMSHGVDDGTFLALLANQDLVPRDQLARRIRAAAAGDPVPLAHEPIAPKVYARALAGDVDGAANDLRNARAAGVYPDAPGLFELQAAGNVLVWADRTEDALLVRQLTLRLYPREWLAHVALAETLAHLERLEEARAAYERALELDPPNPHARAGLEKLGPAGHGAENAR